MNTAAHQNAIAFFYENAGYSYDPKTETAEDGRRKCAAQLAAAEAEARSRGYWFIWDTDSGVMSSDYIDVDEDGGANCDPWITWRCAIVEHVPGSGQPRILESIGGVDFGRNGSPDTSEYSRVVEAELAHVAITP